jgi:hypothetical protein
MRFKFALDNHRVRPAHPFGRHVSVNMKARLNRYALLVCCCMNYSLCNGTVPHRILQIYQLSTIVVYMLNCYFCINQEVQFTYTPFNAVLTLGDHYRDHISYNVSHG